MRVRQRFKQRGIDKSKDGDACTHAKSKNEKCNTGKARFSCKLTNRELDIAKQIVEPNDAASEIEAFLSRLHVAKLDFRLATRFLFAQAFTPQLIRFEFEVRFDLFCKIVWIPSTPEHYLDLLAARSSIENQSHSPRKPLPFVRLFCKLLAPLSCQRIETCLAIVLAHAPFGADPFPVFKALQCEIKRTMIDKDRFFRLAEYGTCYALSVTGAQQESFQNEQV